MNPADGAESQESRQEAKSAGDPRLLASDWRERISIVRLKKGRSLTTAILHVEGNVAPPLEALFLAVGDWKFATGGQVVRRPDENGKMVFWLNAANFQPPLADGV